jgi:hypothetical protein
MKAYFRKYYRLITARYLVSARWNGVQVHPARDFGEAMGWVGCYPNAPVTIAKRTGLRTFRLLGTFN